VKQRVVQARAATVLLLVSCACAPKPPAPMPSDDAMLAFFNEHREVLDSVRTTTQRNPYESGDPVASAAWSRYYVLARRGGGGAVDGPTRIFIPFKVRFLPHNMIDDRGFAWIDSPLQRGERFDTLASLDGLDERAWEKRGQYIRRIEGSWWLYRDIGSRGHED
jgi:hypothetical protein